MATDTQTTIALAHSSTAAQVANQLNALSNVGLVDVSLAQTSNSKTWTVTFITNGGDLPLIQPMFFNASASYHCSACAEFSSSYNSTQVVAAEVTAGGAPRVMTAVIVAEPAKANN